MTPGNDFSTRLKSAKKHRDAAKPYIQETLKFCCFGREHDFDNNGEIAEYDTDTFNSLAEELAGDLAGDLITYYTPSEVKWAEYVVLEAPEEMSEDVLKLVEQREDDLFQLVSGSNYNDIAPQWAFEAASHGTPALWVQMAHLQQPIHCEVVPPQQLLITPGHLGYLDRFREVKVLASSLPALFAGWSVDLSDHMLRTKISRPGETCEVVWGFWIDWSDPAIPKWRCEITVDKKRITPSEPLLLGDLAGSCPLLVGRFNPQTGKAWGRGPGWKALPDLRTMDGVSEMVMSGMEQSLTNTIIYPDDGFLDLSEGLEAGRAYPAHRGFTRDQIYEMPRGNNIEPAWLSEDRLEDRLRRAFFQDGPRQRGDTPPTAAQWIDERRRVQQRLGKPSAPLWSEMILPMIQRFEYLGVQSGRLPEAISHNGNVIKVTPISPLQKAQNQDKVMVARSNLDLAAQTMQERAGEVVDFVATFKNIKRVSGDELTVIREKQQQAAAPPAGQGV